MWTEEEERECWCGRVCDETEFFVAVDEGLYTFVFIIDFFIFFIDEHKHTKPTSLLPFSTYTPRRPRINRNRYRHSRIQRIAYMSLIAVLFRAIHTFSVLSLIDVFHVFFCIFCFVFVYSEYSECAGDG